MPQVEVDEAQYLANLNVVKAVDAMLKHPEARKLVLTAQKKVNPNASIPEIDAAAPIESAVGAVRKEFEDFKAAQAKKEDEAETKRRTDAFSAEWARQKKEIADQRGLTEEGLKMIEDHATKEGIPNFRAAANDWFSLHPPSEPAQPVGFGSFNFFEPTEKEGEDMKKLLETRGEAEGVLNSMVGKALGEVRGSRRAA
jgi:hypothetical protein